MASPCFGADNCACISVHDSSNLRNALGFSGALQSSSALLPLLLGPALWDPVFGALPRGGARCASGTPALAAVRQPGCGAAPQGSPGGAPGDGDARSRAGVRWGAPATAHALPRAAQPGSSLDMQRPTGPQAATCESRIKHHVLGPCSAPRWKCTGGAQPWRLTMPSLWMGSRTPPRCKTAARTVRICALLFVFIFLYFPSFSCRPSWAETWPPSPFPATMPKKHQT